MLPPLMPIDMRWRIVLMTPLPALILRRAFWRWVIATLARRACVRRFAAERTCSVEQPTRSPLHRMAASFFRPSAVVKFLQSQAVATESNETPNLRSAL